jgi:hypothetical protein
MEIKDIIKMDLPVLDSGVIVPVQTAVSGVDGEGHHVR